MTPLEAISPAVIVALLVYRLVCRELDKLSDPRYLRREGVVLLAAGALDGHSGPVGTYRGHEIWATVRFKGMLYRFDRIAPDRRIGPRQLWLPPGLVYLTD